MAFGLDFGSKPPPALTSQPLGQPGSISGAEALWNPQLHQLYNQQLNDALWGTYTGGVPQIDQNTYNILENRIHNSIGSPDQFDVMFQNALTNYQTRSSLDRTRLAATKGLDDYEASQRPYFQSQIGRYDRIFGKGGPGSKGGLGLRSDAEFANFLSGAQNSINADINATRIGAAKGNAARGVSQSGKVTDQLQRATFLGRESMGKAEQGAFETAQRGRDMAYGQMGDFLSGLNQMRIGNESAVQAGEIQFAPLTQQRFNQGLGTTTDLRSLDIGNDRANLALILQAILGIGGLANQAGGQAMSGASNMVGMFKGG